MSTYDSFDPSSLTLNPLAARAEAIEALKKMKRDMGSEMKATIEKQAQQTAMAKRDYVAKAHNTVFDAKNRKRALARAREGAQ